MSPPQSTNSFDYNMAVVANNTLTSPPISPLWTPASPNLSPMGGGAAPANNSNVASNFPMPTFGTISPPAPNPFDLFDVAQPAAPAQSSSAPAAQAGDPFADGDALLLPIPPQRQIASGLQRRQDDDDAANDFWKDMGFGLPPPSINSGNSRGDRRGGGVDVARGGGDSDDRSRSGDGSHSDEDDDDDGDDDEDDDGYDGPGGGSSRDDAPVSLDGRGLPSGGEYYTARVITPLLGAIFTSGHELRSTLLKTASDSFVSAIGDRPVISFVIDGSAADTAGIGLGHVLLSVNGEDVTDTDGAVRTISAAPRPMTMEFYIPSKEVRVVKTEAQCMVKYDDQSTDAPQNASGWKPKYVVVGDILGKPHILYMYRSKVG